MSKPSLTKLSGAYNGLGAKIKKARLYYLESWRYPIIRQFAENAAGKGSRLTQARSLFRVLKQAYHYVGDHVGFETTKAPWVVIEEISNKGFSGGDCDDQAFTNYTLLKSIGIDARLRVSWSNGKDPVHIYVVAFINNRWIPFDTTGKQMGQEFPARRYKDFS